MINYSDRIAAAASGSFHHALARYIAFTASLTARGRRKIRTSSYPCEDDIDLFELVHYALVPLEFVLPEQIHCEPATVL